MRPQNIQPTLGQMLQYHGATQNQEGPLRARKNNEEEQEYNYDYQEEIFEGEDQHAEYDKNHECIDEQLRARPMMSIRMRPFVLSPDIPILLN